MKRQEQVLVTINRPSIHWGATDYFHIEANGNEAWMDEVIAGASFVDRWLAEQDSSILQLIPYVAMIAPDGKVFSYQRKGGGEGRLDGKHSVGIGGHINPVDTGSKEGKAPLDITWQTVTEAAVREVTEEIVADPDYVRANIKQVGILYTPNCQDFDKSKPGPTVHEVHLGIVYILPLLNNAVQVKEEDHLINYKWVGNPSDVTKYENWSQLVLGSIDKIRGLL